ncbi:hypothetical protein DICA1_E04390 [Diutina catenulata]
MTSRVFQSRFVGGLAGALVVMMAAYLWMWLRKGANEIILARLPQASNIPGAEFLINVLGKDSEATSFGIPAYDRIYARHSVQSVLSLDLIDRCSLFFAHSQIQPLVDNYQQFSSFVEFKSLPDVRRNYYNPNPDTHDYGYNIYAQGEYRQAVIDRDSAESTLAGAMANVRIFTRCYLNSDDSFVKKQKQRVQAVTDKFSPAEDESYEEENSTIEARIFPWLTGVMPESLKYNNARPRSRIGRREPFLAQLKSQWHSRGIVLMAHPEVEATVAKLRRLSDLPIEIITTELLSIDGVRVIHIGDSVSDVELSPAIAALFSSFCYTIIVTSPDIDEAMLRGSMEGEASVILNTRLWQLLAPSINDEVIFGLTARRHTKITQPQVMVVDKSTDLQTILLSVELSRHPALEEYVNGNYLAYGSLISSYSA